MKDKPKIFIGADHNGFDLKNLIAEYLTRGGYDVTDCGDTERHPDDDYPQFAAQVINAMIGDPSYDVRGILLCGSGQGMCIAANRYNGVRAIIGYNQDVARIGRNDDDSNVICLPAHELDMEQAAAIINTWLMTPFAGAPRFKRRIKEVDELN